MTQTPEIAQLVVAARDGSPSGLRRARPSHVRRHVHARLSVDRQRGGCARRGAGRVSPCLPRRAAVPRDAQFSTWLYRITANCASTHVGRRRRHQHDPLDADAAVIDIRPESDPQARADATVAREQLEAALILLPPPPAGGRRASRRVRPASRGDRGRARHLGDRREGQAAPGSAPSARAGVHPSGRWNRRRRLGSCGVRRWASCWPRPPRGSRSLTAPRRPRRALLALPGRPRAVPTAASGVAPAGRPPADPVQRVGRGGARRPRRGERRHDRRTHPSTRRHARRHGRCDGRGSGQRAGVEPVAASPGGLNPAIRGRTAWLFGGVPLLALAVPM